MLNDKEGLPWKSPAVGPSAQREQYLLLILGDKCVWFENKKMSSVAGIHGMGEW